MSRLFDATSSILMSFNLITFREIHCVRLDNPNSHSVTPWNLEGYLQLETVRLDWMSTRNIRMFFRSSDDVPFVNTPSTVVNFDFRGRYWPFPSAYSFIPRCLSFIRRLVLYQQNVWCGLCFTINDVEFRQPDPHRFQYDGGFGLPVSVIYSAVLPSQRWNPFADTLCEGFRAIGIP